MHGSSKSKYGLVGLGLATTFMSFVVTLELSTPVASSGANPIIVERGLKGDRLPLAPPARSAGPARDDPQLPDGCVTRFDPRKNIFSSEVAGRCVV
ncbi:MAG: hypothetical protein ACRECO_12380 [Xanthobacteraceae bacterium]